jgi:ribonuclease R
MKEKNKVNKEVIEDVLDEKAVNDKVETVYDFMKNEKYSPMTIEDMMFVLAVPKKQKQKFQATLGKMETLGKIIKTQKNKYILTEKLSLISAKFESTSKSFGFAIPDDKEMKDIFIEGSNTNTALSGDRVLVRITKEEKSGKRAEGTVEKILERGSSVIVGKFQMGKSFGFLVPDDKKFKRDIYIPKENINNAKDGQKAVIKITFWGDEVKSPEGEVIEVLGYPEEKGIDVMSVMRQFGFYEEFPTEVMDELKKISDEVEEKDKEGREDLRDLVMVTIDGEDAKDLDDAVSVEKLPNGNYSLGVHIADVSHYVTEKSALDREAFKRGTSVYFVDRVIPMIPRKLSNGLCSLNAKKDRLALSVIMEIDHSGHVVNHKMMESVINVNERMTYTNVKKIILDKDPEAIEQYKELVPCFEMMKDLALIIRKERKNRGSIDFDFPESKVIVDEKGIAIDVKPYEITLANNIIEDFMVIANETVAEHMFWLSSPFVYRIHEEPKEEKMEALMILLNNFGYTLKGTANSVHPKSLQQIIEKIKGKTEEHIISTITLRSLQQARYSPECVGHFGLASKYYCHFTSPIRRYPDLSIHRIIREVLFRGGLTDKKDKKFRTFVQQSSDNSSIMERKAQEAERTVEDIKKAEYMKTKIGETYTGIISSVTSFGFFVMLPNTIEGLVAARDMQDDYYIYMEDQYCLLGERTRRVYRLGDEVTIKVVSVSIEQGEINFSVV